MDGDYSQDAVALEEVLQRHGVKPSKALVEDLIRHYSRQERASGHIEARPVVDPVSGLKLPPTLPTDYIPFHGRSAKYGKKIPATEFLEREGVWSAYALQGLLYTEHIRSLDESLYFALMRQGRTRGLSLADFAKEIGILTLEDLRNPPKGRERQATLLRAVRNIRRAGGLERTAEALLGGRQ